MNRIKKINQINSGFTFMETIAVLAVTAVLSAGIGLSALKLLDRAREVHTRQQISIYKTALDSYYFDCGTFPTAEQGLEALWNKPILNPVPQGWNGPYIDRMVQRDAWNNCYVYITRKSGKFPSEANQNLPYVIMSYGADGQKGGEGKNADVVSWE